MSCDHLMDKILLKKKKKKKKKTQNFHEKV